MVAVGLAEYSVINFHAQFMPEREDVRIRGPGEEYAHGAGYDGDPRKQNGQTEKAVRRSGQPKTRQLTREKRLSINSLGIGDAREKRKQSTKRSGFRQSTKHHQDKEAEKLPLPPL